MRVEWEERENEEQPLHVSQSYMNFDQHLAALAACRLCPNVLGSPVTGAVADARVMLVGQAPGPREMEQRRPFAFTAGRRLFAWFERLGVSARLRAQGRQQ